MLTPGSNIGRYVVQRKLAEGGMAELYLCTAVGPEGFAKEVVLKVVRGFLATDPGFVKMFVDEARLASRLNHANVVQLFDFDKHEDRHYIAMEYVRGASLSELKKRSVAAGLPIPATLAAEICARVARGLHHAHTQTDRGQPMGLVHRDVTPQNILLAFDGSVKLTDFGIAKANSSATAPGMLKGKFAYMAPEQARGETVDPRTDVFALGIVLWELLTGGRLFEGPSDIAVMRAVQEAVIAPPSRLNPQVPPALSALTLKALERDRKSRFQSAGELERALSEFVVANARSLEDTRVDVFMRPLFPEDVEDEAPLQPTGSMVLADTLKGGRRGLPASSAPTSPLRTALTASSSPTTPMPELAPASSKTDRQPGLRQSVPRLKAAASPTLATPAEPEKEPTQRHDAGASETMDEPPGVPTASMRKSLKVRPVEAFDRDEVPPPGTVRPRAPWVKVTVGIAALAAVALAVLVVNAQAKASASQAVVEVTPPPVPAPKPKPLPPPVEEVAAVAPAVAAAEPTPERVASPEPVAEPPAADGFLDVFARPYATLTLNGKAMGDVDPHKTFRLKPGKYLVLLEHPRLRQGPTQVTVRPGAKTRVDFNAEAK